MFGTLFATLLRTTHASKDRGTLCAIVKSWCQQMVLATPTATADSSMKKAAFCPSPHCAIFREWERGLGGTHSKHTRNLPPWVRSCNRFAAAVYYTATYIITAARHNNGATYGISRCLWNHRARNRFRRFSGKAVAFRDVAAFRSWSCVCDKLSTLYCMLVKNRWT